MHDQPREVLVLRRLHELMCSVNAEQDLPTVLQSLVDGVADVTGFGVAAVSYLHPDDHLEVVAVAGDDTAREQLIGIRTPLQVLTGEFEIADTWGLLRFVPHERLQGLVRGWIPDVNPLDAPDAWHPEDALLAPLSAPTGEMVGLLSVDLPHDGRRPGQFARDTLEMYAVQAGIAINNAKQRDRLREQVRLATTVREVVQRVGNALELETVIDECVAPLARGLDCAALWVQTFEGSGEGPGRGRGAVHPAGGPVPPDDLVEMGHRLAVRCWRERSAVALPDHPLAPADSMPADDRRRALGFVAESGATTFLLAPMGAGRECLGYLMLARAGDTATWSGAEISAVLEIGRDLGRAALHARLYEQEHRLVRRLQQLDRYKTEMISTLTHELKNPLTAILGHVEILDADEADTGRRRSLAAIERGARRLSGVIEDLLVLSRVSDPNRPFAPVPVDLTEIVAEVADLLTPVAARQHVELVLEGLKDKVPVPGEPSELDRLVANLLGNAVKFSPDGGTVTCALEIDDSEVHLVVRDEGLGISAEDQDQLFGEFFRSTNPAALQVPGTGLGLSIVQRIVDRHGGRIALDSRLGRGTTVTVSLPLWV